MEGWFKLWEEGKVDQLWKDVVEGVGGKKGNTSNGENIAQDVRIRAAVAAAREGNFSKACGALGSCASPVVNELSLAKLTELQRRAGAPATIPSILPKACVFTETEVAVALNGFGALSAPGPFGMRAEFVKEVLDVPSQISILNYLTSVINILVKGNVPADVTPWLCGADLTAIPKKGPVGAVRPIAAGCMIRRLAAKCFCARYKSEWADRLKEWQVGVAVRGGAEALVHLVTQKWGEHITDEDYVFLKVDMRNAYNRCSRKIFIEWACEHCPDMARFVNLCYGESSKLIHGKWTIDSEEGTQQGDGLASILFVACLEKVRGGLSKRFGNKLDLNHWYIDDGILAGQAKHVRKAFQYICDEFPKAGLDPNPTKCQLCWPSAERGGNSLFPKEVERYPGTGMDLLGSPIGNEEHCQAYITRKAETLSTLFGALADINNPHISYVLLKQCVSYGRMVHFMRTVPKKKIGDNARGFDDKVKAVLEDIMAMPVTRRAWIRAGVSVNAGGLGLRRVEEHCGGAYLASTLLGRKVFDEIKTDSEHIQDAIEDVNGRVDEDDQVNIGTIFNQHNISISIDKQTILKHLTELGPVERGMMVSSWGKGAGAWLQGTPSIYHKTELAADDCRTALAVRLGLNVLVEGMCLEPKCHEHSDALGSHAMRCKCGGDICSRHNALARVFHDECSVASLQPQLETQFLVPGTQKRPGDVTVASYDGEGRTAFDFACISSTQIKYLGRSQTEAASAAERYEKEVKGKVALSCPEGLKYIPLVCDNMGAWTETAQQVFKRVAHAAADRTGMKRAVREHRLYQKLSVALWRANAKAIRIRRPMNREVPCNSSYVCPAPVEKTQILNSWIVAMEACGAEVEVVEEIRSCNDFDLFKMGDTMNKLGDEGGARGSAPGCKW
jgi:hypothetical protein